MLHLSDVREDKTIVKYRIDEDHKPKARERIPCLEVLEGGWKGDVFQIRKKSVLLGRGSQSDIFLGNDGVSRQHARIDKHESGYTLTDLESTNGTLVNGAPIKQVALRDGDKILLGEVLLRFSLRDSFEIEHQKELKNLALKDGLTNIPNQQFFLEVLVREVLYALRVRQSLTCLMFNVDHLQRINKEYGSKAGDLILKKITQSLSEGLRAYDVLARYAEEEFAILLRGTALENALVFAERIRKRAEQLVVEYQGNRIPITISVGVSALNLDYALEPKDLVTEASRYLSEAKKQGFNRVCSARDQL